MNETSETSAPDPRSSPSEDLSDLSLRLVVIVCGAFVVLEIGATLLLARTATPGILDRFSAGSLTLEAIIALLEVTLVTLLLAVDRVHPSAAGLRLGQIPRALLLGIAIWGLSQLSLAIVSLGRHGTISLYAGWAEPAAMIAPLLKRLLADVFVEEIFWRGLLFMWILRVLEKRRWQDPLTRLGTALLCSQILFGITRLPAQIAGAPPEGIPSGASLVAFTLTGMFYALVYLRTGNLWLVMAVHTLALWPLPLVAFDLDPSKITVLVSAVLLISPGWGAPVRVKRGLMGSP